MAGSNPAAPFITGPSVLALEVTDPPLAGQGWEHGAEGIQGEGVRRRKSSPCTHPQPWSSAVPWVYHLPAVTYSGALVTSYLQ